MPGAKERLQVSLVVDLLIGVDRTLASVLFMKPQMDELLVSIHTAHNEIEVLCCVPRARHRAEISIPALLESTGR